MRRFFRRPEPRLRTLTHFPEDERRDRVEFLRATQAVPTHAFIYALWLGVYRAQGNDIGPVQHFNYANYALTGYDQLPYDKWMPTKDVSVSRIPVGYGSRGMQVMLLPDLIDCRHSLSGLEGWEFGHTTVLSLALGDGPYGLIARSNETWPPYSYCDIEAIQAEKDLDQLAAEFRSYLSSAKRTDRK